MKYCKLLLILSLTLAAVLPADAQRIKKYPKHEFSVGVGIAGRNTDAIREFTDFDFDDNVYFYDYYNEWSGSSSWDKFEKSKYYLSQIKSTPAIFGRYFYNLYDWLQLGGTISYGNVFQERFATVSRRVDSKARTHYASIIPTVRLNFVRGNYFRMYASFGIGYTMALVKGFDDNSYKPYHLTAVDITFLGISVGRKWFASAEGGIYTCGYGKFAVGCRF